MKSQLIIMFVLVLLMTTIPVSMIVNTKVRGEIMENYIHSSTGQIVQINNAINILFKDIEENVNYLAENAYVKKADHTVTSYMDKVTEEALKMTPSQNGGLEQTIYEAFLQYKETHPQTAYVYMGTAFGGYIQLPEGSTSKNYDPRKRPYYQKAMENRGNASRTNPYYYEPDNSMVVSTVKTVENEAGELIGVIGVDMSLKGMTKIFKSIKMGDTGYVMLIDNQGTIIADPKNEENNFKNIQEIGIDGFKNIPQISSDYFETKVNNVSYIANVYTSPETGWKFIAMITKDELMSSANKIRSTIMLLSTLFILFGIIMTWMFSNKLSKPIVFVSEHLKFVATGNFTKKMPDTFIKRKDEIGVLVNAVNIMQEDMKNIIKKVKHSSELVTTSSNNLSEISQQSAQATGEIAQAIEQIASSTNDQARDTETIASMANGLGEKINESNQLIYDVYDISQEANTLGEKGINILKVLYDKISNNTQKSDEINSIIEKINEFANNAESIIVLIENISNQTNLLALNASIEAARAGEAGKGFAVVADEIRKLSEETTKATDDIKELMKNIQQNSGKAVNTMDEVKGIVKEQNGSIEETDHIFQDTIGSMKNLIEKINQVAEHAENMKKSKDEIIDAITNISAVTEETSASTEEVSASTEEQLASVEEISSHAQSLSSVAVELKEDIDKFII
ncbi:MAG: methyl-accepting chemotaxis protein [Marinisporobacter sp.]|jgi:methyl-accepting chemotaxis protein|nr:methyl-accepting chemotaxis protein [Marinisporobacter sp.]